MGETIRRLVAEATATFAITLCAMGVDVPYYGGNGVDYASRWLARGFVAAAAIYAFSELSGAHANPAVTLGFALRGVFPWLRALGYVLAQFGGALVAAGLVFALYGSAAIAGASHPGPAFSPAAAACAETVLTFLLMLVILCTASEEAVVGKDAALAIGFTIAACGFFGGTVSGASMNPARTIAPEMVGGRLGFAWVYSLGPAAGAALAVGLHWLLYGAPRPRERKVAKGR